MSPSGQLYMLRWIHCEPTQILLKHGCLQGRLDSANEKDVNLHLPMSTYVDGIASGLDALAPGQPGRHMRSTNYDGMIENHHMKKAEQTEKTERME